MKNSYAYCIALLVLTFSACRRPKELEYRNVQNFQLKQAGVKETKISADIFLYNPNRFSLKLKRADVAVFLNDRLVGNVSLDSLFMIPRNDSFLLPVTLSLDMTNVLPDALQLLFNSQVAIKIKGSIKAGKHGLYVAVPVNYEGKQDVMDWMK
jgi:LEA14-like dessication related protein